MREPWRVGAIGAVVVLLAQGLLAEEPKEGRFAGQVRQLNPREFDTKARLSALEWIEQHCTDPDARKTIPALERCLRTDPEAEVRVRAASTLGMVAYQPRDRVCPLALIEAIQDKDEEVRGLAAGYASMFKTFAPGTLPILLCCVEEKRYDVRVHALTLLARAAPRDDNSLRVVRGATADKHFLVRDQAQVSLFRMTDDLGVLVPYCLRVRVELSGREQPGAGATEAEKVESCQKNLVELTAFLRLYGFALDRTDDLADLLVTLSRHESAVVRRGVADFVAEFAKACETLLDPKEPDPVNLLPQNLAAGTILDPKAMGEVRRKQAEKVGKALERMGERKVKAALQRLKDDTDRDVSKAAEAALKRLATDRE